MSISIEQLAAEKGYQIAKMKKGANGNRIATLEKAGRTVVVDEQFLADVVSIPRPVQLKAAG